MRLLALLAMGNEYARYLRILNFDKETAEQYREAKSNFHTLSRKMRTHLGLSQGLFYLTGYDPQDFAAKQHNKYISTPPLNQNYIRHNCF